MNLDAKLEAALVKLLQGEVFPAYFDKTTAIHAGQTDDVIEGQFIRCVAAKEADEEYPLNTGNYWWPVEIQLRTPAIERNAEETPPSDEHRAVARVMDDAIQVDYLREQITAAAAALGAGFELTVQGYDQLVPASEQDPDAWVTGWKIRLLICDSALAA